MSEFIGDLDTPFEAPIAAANEGYAQLSPGFGRFAGAMLGEGPTAYLARAAERGSQAGSSWFDRVLAEQGSVEQLPETGELPGPDASPLLAADDANRAYGPIGADGKPVAITDQPITEGLARIIGRQKGEALAREGVIARYQNANSWPVNLLSGAAASLADPLNLAASLVPPFGESAVLGQLARIGITGFPGRTVARAAAAGAAGAAVALPETGIEAALAPEEAGELSARDALSRVLYSAAGFAALHAGIAGPARDLWQRAQGLPLESGRPALPIPAPGSPADEAAAVLRAPADVTRDAMVAATAQALDGRPIDVAPVVGPAAGPAVGSWQRPEPMPANTPEYLVARQAAADSENAVRRPADIIDFLRDQGGVRDEGGDLAAMDLDKSPARFQRALAQPDGLSLDHAREVAAEAGYLPREGSTIADLLEAVQRTALGEPVFVPQEGAVYRGQLAARDRAVADAELFDPRNLFADFAESQQRLDREGWAPAMREDEFAAAQEEVYGQGSGIGDQGSEAPAAAAEAAAPAAAPGAPAAEAASGASPEPAVPGAPEVAARESRPVDPEIAEAERQLALAPEEHVSPEDRAELGRSEAALGQAEDQAAAAEEAGQCLSERLL